MAITTTQAELHDRRGADAKPDPKDWYKSEALQAYRIRRGFDRLGAVLTGIGVLLIASAFALIYISATPEAASAAFGTWLLSKVLGWLALSSVVIEVLKWVAVGFARDETLYKERRDQYFEALSAWYDRSAI